MAIPKEACKDGILGNILTQIRELFIKIFKPLGKLQSGLQPPQRAIATPRYAEKFPTQQQHNLRVCPTALPPPPTQDSQRPRRRFGTTDLDCE